MHFLQMGRFRLVDRQPLAPGIAAGDPCDELYRLAFVGELTAQAGRA